MGDIFESPALRVCLDIVLPSLAHGLAPTCGEEGTEAQLLGGGSIMPVMVHDSIGGCDGPFRAGTLKEAEKVAGLDRTFLKDAKIPAGETGAFHLQGQILHLPAARQFPAGLPGLRNLYEGRADGKHVADADRCFREVVEREVFTEGAADEPLGRQGPMPIGPMVRRIGTDGLVDSSMVDEIRLAVSLEILPTQDDRPADWNLEDAGRPRTGPMVVDAVRLLGARKTDLDGTESPRRHAHVLDLWRWCLFAATPITAVGPGLPARPGRERGPLRIGPRPPDCVARRFEGCRHLRAGPPGGGSS